MNFGLVRGICGSLIRPDGDGDVRSRTGSSQISTFLWTHLPRTLIAPYSQKQKRF